MMNTKSKLIFGFLVFLFALLVTSSPAKAVTFTRSVFLQNVTTNSVDFRWVTDTNEQLVVKYGTSTSYGSQVNSDTVSGTGGAHNHAKISTGLTANTKYYYQITTVGGTALTPAGDQNHYFTTAPATGSSTPFTWVAWGDSGENNSAQDSVAKGVFNAKPNLAIVAGDIGYPYSADFANNNLKHFNHYSDKTPGQNSMSFAPYYVTCGNHETSCSTVIADHTLPGNGNMGNFTSTYSFNYGNVHFVALNSNGSYSYPSDSQMSWALNDLRNSGQPWKVIFWHHNGWSHGSHSTDTTRQTQIGNLARDGGAQIVFWGHSHSYERWNRTNGSNYTNPFPNTQFFTVGNGGNAEAPSCSPSGTNTDPGCAKGDKGPGYILGRVNGNQMVIDYYQGTSTTPFDSVTLNSTGGGPTNPPTNTPTRPPNATNTPTSTPTRTPTPGGPTNTPGGQRLGDANCDGQINGSDYVVWSSRYLQSPGSCPQDPDFNNDSRVDGVDYAIWLNAMGGGGTNTPSIQILSPADGSTVSPNFQVQFQISNWSF